MKKIIFILTLLAALLGGYSCSKDPVYVSGSSTQKPDDGGNNPGNGDSQSTPSNPATPDEWDGQKRADLGYQLLIYSFADSDADGIGDFQGIIDKLDYLDELGVSALWLSPAHPAMSYHGYDVLDYEALNPDYGTEEDFRRLIDEAHRRGIRICMDWVINHTGKDHPWFRAALSDENSPYRDYYIFSNDPQADISAGRIPMINTEGSRGYDAGQWFSATSSDSSEGQKLKFTLQWGSSPTLTVEQVDEISNSGTPAADRFLYYGDSGISAPFYSQGGDLYTLSLEFASTWGCLVRTSTSTWDAGTKYGAPSATNNTMEWGVPFTLVANVGSAAAADILIPGMKQIMYHSHFWTDWFADLNYGAADTCETSPAFNAICEAACKWIDMGIDGLRLDGAKHIYHNADSDENHIFWGKMYETLDRYYRSQGKGLREEFYMVGEVFDDVDKAAPYYKGLPAIFDFAFWYRLKSAVTSNTGRYFVKDILSQNAKYQAYRADYIATPKLTNHDENRARTDFGGSLEKARLAGAMLLTSGGFPYIYYGEELGYVGNKSNGDEYVRTPMKWGDGYTTDYLEKIGAGSKVDAGMSSVADVASQSGDAASILSVYRAFGQVRNTYTALAQGQMEKHSVYNENNSKFNSIAAWYMSDGSQRMLVLHNISASTVSLPVTDDIDKAVAVSGTMSFDGGSGSTTVRLGGYSSAVFLLK